MEKEPITLNGLKKLEEELIFLKVIGSFSIFYFHFAKGGNDIKIPSTLPPVCNPNLVPLS